MHDERCQQRKKKNITHSHLLIAHAEKLQASVSELLYSDSALIAHHTKVSVRDFIYYLFGSVSAFSLLLEEPFLLSLVN